MREIGMKLVHPPKTMILSNGPVDGADDYDSDEPCPQCKQNLIFTPAQHGTCHSGLYATEQFVDIYWCNNCEDTFVDEEAARNEAANELNRHKGTRRIAD